MNRILIACASLLWFGTATAQILECVDAKGKKEFAQTCPPGTVRETKLMKSGGGASSAPAPKSLADQEAAFKKRSLERQEAGAKADKEKADAKDAERNCADARGQLKDLQDGMRVARTDPKTGERSFLEDKDRPNEIANARKAVENWCKK